ncbi:hypothetical protein LCM10_03210 [Rossellomorea aquimaris]|uniref:hypothetical protein n=1 Tax=Rossellomorea aquimaris TaxID=189382 RepID=UPI001CD1A2E6|nr:hypothetical protein [Rossellomorea aquimaris]MCA1053984.1 hypothetical protein [Rossellomorea aquimaris]
MGRRKAWLCVLLFTSVIGMLVSSEFSVKSGYALSRQEMALHWLQRQLDPPKYPVDISLDEDYPWEPVDHLSGTVDVSTINNNEFEVRIYSISDIPYLQTILPVRR